MSRPPAATPAPWSRATHRIDPAVIRADFERAGFVHDGESSLLRNPADDTSKNVFDPSIRGRTDRWSTGSGARADRKRGTFMKKLFAAAAALLLMGQAAPTSSVADLACMSGNLATSQGGRWTDEAVAPRAGMMLGHSRSGRGDGLREFEFLRLQAGADGVPVYFAQPGGRPAVPFRLTARDGTGATFENPANDYPQRIRYRRDGDILVATISKLDGSNAMRWTYRRQRGGR